MLSPAVQRAWERLQRRAVAIRPDMTLAIIRAFEAIAEGLTDAELLALVESQAFGSVLTEALSDELLDGAFAKVEAQMFTTTSENVAFFASELPLRGRLNGVLVAQFNILDPEVVPAIRALNTKVITTLKADVREVVRAFVENGLRDGRAPRAIAREIRQVVGLAPNQLRAVENFRTALQNGDASVFRRKLRNRTFDAQLRKAFAGDGLTEAQIQRMTASYRTRFIQFNADVNARTATLDALKLAKHQSTRSAIRAGLLDATRMRSRWANSGDGRVRDLHVQVNGQVVLFGQPFATGDVIPGASEFQCRCIKVDFQVAKTAAQEMGALVA